MIALVVALGAAIGAPARYLTDRAVQTRHDWPVPLGTLVVNIAASFVLGLLAGSAASTQVAALVGTGFCGALSTFSTFSYETMRLAQHRVRWLVAANVAVSVVVGVAAAALGWWLASTIRG